MTANLIFPYTILSMLKRNTLVILCSFVTVLFLAGSAEAGIGGGGVVMPGPTVKKATISNGKLIAPTDAPTRVKQVIQAANEISDKPYSYGGGHRSFKSKGYDCSGAVSYALKGGNFLSSPLASPALMSWGQAGKGKWITVYSHRSHAYMVVAGFRFDTSGTNNKGPRWQKDNVSSRGFKVRSPKGY